ncbi:MAG TPA: hypothetical protein VFN91_17395, partial [Myxococcaceae bacterium]|nr:hypothetical protein [Myxococcaceae bacterium]
MQKVIDQLFSTDAGQAMAAGSELRAHGARSAADANAILGALAREAPKEKGVRMPKHHLLASIQSCESEEARAVFKEKATGAIIAAYPRLGDADTFALKILALLDEREGLEFLARRITDENGPTDFFVSTALGQINPRTRHIGVLFPTLSSVLGYPDFRAVAVLDLANRLTLAGTLASHPAVSHVDKLKDFLESKDEGEFSYAVSASLALAFIPGPAAERLLEHAETHPDAAVRLEATYALARRGHPGSDQKLAAKTLDPE